MLRKVGSFIAITLIASTITQAFAQDRQVTTTTTTITKEEKTVKVVRSAKNQPKRQVLTGGAKEFIKLSELLKEYSYRDDPAVFQGYCEAYAILAVRQAESRLKNRCESVISSEQGDLSRRWNVDPLPQYDWCLTVKAVRTGAEAKYRERRLNDCDES